MEIAYYPKTELLDDIANRAQTWLSGNSENLNDIKIVGYDKEEELEKQVQINGAIAGLRFSDDFIKADVCPKLISYQIRFPSETRIQLKPVFIASWETNDLYDVLEFAVIRGKKFLYDSSPFYYDEGFLGIQHAFSMAFVEKLQKNGIENKPWFFQRLPYKPFVADKLLYKIENMISFLLIIGYMYISTQIVKSVTNEKQKQLKEIMEIMGLPTILHWCAWFIRYFVTTLITAIIMVILLKIPWTKNVAFLNYSSWMILILFFMLYSIALITFSFMISSFFTNPNTAAAVTGIVMFGWFLPCVFAIPTYNSQSATMKYFLSLFFNSGLGFGLRVMLKSEMGKYGINWNNLFEEQDDNICLGYIMIIFVFVSFIHMLIALYVEKIFPGDYGVPYKWYFPFTKEFWQQKKSLPTEIRFKSIRNPDFEEEPTYKEVRLKIDNLRKVFAQGSKVAVKELSLNLYENEITVFLGHNGAGKTTIMSMLTGMIPPTSGTAFLNGYDITKNLEEARMSLGFCPQHNILFDSLTVREHLVFYSRLKGLNPQEVEKEVEKFLDILNLKLKKNTVSANLAGGMKRRLSISAALCGGSKVVLCDEPTSGMDPAARRAVWNLLELEKNGRTILISTHFMDEADVLGDRIAIMAGGELKAFGSPFFLKKKYGAGYYLICEKEQDCDSTKVTELLRNYIPHIEVESDIGFELSYKLEEKYSNIFEIMLKDLEENSEKIKIGGYGISNPTLEEVFMLLGSARHHSSLSVTRQSIKQLSDSIRIDNYLVNTEESLATGKKLFCKQWKAMFLKKYLVTKRNIIFFLLGNGIAIFFYIVAIIVYFMFPEYSDLKPFKLNVAAYKNTITVLESNDESSNKILEEYEKYIQTFGEGHEVIHIKTDIKDYILNLKKEVLLIANPAYLVGATILKDSVVAWFNGQFYHALPTSINALHNAMLRSTTGDPSYLIEAVNYPFPYTEATRVERSGWRDFAYELGVYYPIGMSFVTALYILFQIKERVSRAKLLQFVCGLQKILFWISAYLIDLITLLFTVMLCIIIMYIVKIEDVDIQSQLDIILVVLIIYSVSSLIFIYLTSFLFSDAPTGFSKMAIMSMFTGSGLHFVFTVLKDNINEDILPLIHSILSIFPSYFLSYSLQNIMKLSAKKKLCIKQCIKFMGSCSLADACKINEECCVPDIFDKKSPGIADNIGIIMAATLFYLFFLIFIECGAFNVVKEAFHGLYYKKFRNPNKTISFNYDNDIKKEKFKVNQMSQKEILSTNLVMNRVTKYYKKFIAVKEVSAQVPELECFGLLGVNGAGKTTLFKILTGEEKMSYGEAYVNGLSIKTEMSKVHKKIGYCPQFEALLEELTGRETLRIFALIRGVKEINIPYISEALAKGFGFFQYINNRVYTYSGGNKRKLSTAVAVLGGPSVIYLDEPTTGMDPGARRQLWNKICEVRDAGKTVVLTSHNMDECEALCTRLVMMVNGEFQCIGSIQHLKNTFSEGFILKIKVKKGGDHENAIKTDLRRYSKRLSGLENNLTEQNIDIVTKFITSEFKNASLKEQYSEYLTFSIPKESTTWYNIFGTMEKQKSVLNIEDYSVTQTTLEAILLNMAKKQSFDTRIGQ